jgi:hypothetical protein
MITTINTMRKTSTEWGMQNPVLPYDMLGIEELGNGKYKIKRGDGTSAWNSLGYFTGAELSREECDGIVGDYTVNQKSMIPAPNKAAVYDGHKGLKSDKTPADENDVVRLKELQNADTALQGDIAAEASAREGADTALGGDIAAEAAAREGADTGLENAIEDINAKIGALNGASFVVDPYNFGKNLDVQDTDDVLILNTYAISQTPGASSVGGLNDNTVIINEFDNSEFIYNKQLDIWLFYPNGLLTIATNQSLGVVKGVSDPGDGSKDGAVTVNLHGEMEAIGFAGLKSRMGAAETDIAGKVNIQQNASDVGKAILVGVDGNTVIGKPALLADGAASDDVIGNRTLTDEAADAVLVPVTAKKLLPWLQGIRNNLKWAFNNLLTTTAANTWVVVEFTAGSAVTLANFYARYNAALGILRVHFDQDVVNTFTIGMTVATLTLPTSTGNTKRFRIGADLYSGSTTLQGRGSLSVNLLVDGKVNIFPAIQQGSGAVPAWDGCKLFGDGWVYL